MGASVTRGPWPGGLVGLVANVWDSAPGACMVSCTALSFWTAVIEK